MQVGVAGLLEAASRLLAQGFVPKRTLMFAFGQDEEVGGDKGAGGREGWEATLWCLNQGGRWAGGE